MISKLPQQPQCCYGQFTIANLVSNQNVVFAKQPEVVTREWVNGIVANLQCFLMSIASGFHFFFNFVSKLGRRTIFWVILKCSARSHYSLFMGYREVFRCFLLFDDFVQRKRKRSTIKIFFFSSFNENETFMFCRRIKWEDVFHRMLAVAGHVNLQHKFPVKVNGFSVAGTKRDVRNHVCFHNKKREKNSGKHSKLDY